MAYTEDVSQALPTIPSPFAGRTRGWSIGLRRCVCVVALVIQAAMVGSSDLLPSIGFGEVDISCSAIGIHGTPLFHAIGVYTYSGLAVNNTLYIYCTRILIDGSLTGMYGYALGSICAIFTANLSYTGKYVQRPCKGIVCVRHDGARHRGGTSPLYKIS